MGKKDLQSMEYIEKGHGLIDRKRYEFPSTDSEQTEASLIER